MTKQNAVRQDKAVCAILSVVAELNTIDVLEEKTKRICAEYFPCAEKVLENAFLDFAVSVQSVRCYAQSLSIEINRYNRNHK